MQPEILIAAGRIAFGLFFIIAAYRNARRFTFWTGNKTNYGWPLPAALLALGFATQAIAGVLLVVDLYTVWAALALIVFLFVATPLYHNPLMFKPEERGLHIYLNLVNLLLVAVLVQIIGIALTAP